MLKKSLVSHAEPWRVETRTFLSGVLASLRGAGNTGGGFSVSSVLWRAKIDFYSVLDKSF
jgi:hypothetical protein